MAAVIAVVDEGHDRFFKRAWQVVVLQQDAVFERLISALDLALGLRMIWCPSNMVHNGPCNWASMFSQNNRYV